MFVTGRLEPEVAAAAVAAALSAGPPAALALVDLFPDGLESRRIRVRTI
jgi:hypothetical protein